MSDPSTPIPPVQQPVEPQDLRRLADRSPSLTHLDCVAIDVGYGQVKLVAGPRHAPILKSFASIALPHHGGAISASGFGQAQAIHKIKIGSQAYQVGPGVADAASGRLAQQPRTDHYAVSDDHLALMGGALAELAAGSVKVLCLGLPMHLYEQVRPQMAARLANGIPTPSGPVRPEINLLIPQALGASRHLALHARTSGTRLVVDVGFHTTDWVLSRGFAYQEDRSGGAPGGVAQVCTYIAETLGKRLGCNIVDLRPIDEALRTPDQVWKRHGQRHELASLLPRHLLKQTVDAVLTRVQFKEDIDELVLVGGGAALYAAQFREQFAPCSVQVHHDARFANALGFWLIGHAELAKRAKQASASS